ncbi:hypothetical protein BH10PSE12_BH10PSE12_25370 [soil metagenome]
MRKSLILTAALIVAAPAVAAPQQAAPAQEPADSANATPGATSVAAIVDSEFPAYDADKSGQLEQPEFAKWMIALKDQELKATGKSLPPAEVTAWASGAFTSADADKSTAVSKPELVKYLSGGAA